ncbi:hypothetical protein D3C71_1975900 [compost metagenome]
MGEALNMDVSFDADLGIELKEKGAATVTEPTNPPKSLTKEEIESKISYYNRLIWTANVNITMFKENILLNPDKADELNKSIGEQQAKITDYESQISALQAQK